MGKKVLHGRKKFGVHDDVKLLMGEFATLAHFLNFLHSIGLKKFKKGVGRWLAYFHVGHLITKPRFF